MTRTALALALVLTIVHRADACSIVRFIGLPDENAVAIIGRVTAYTSQSSPIGQVEAIKS